MRSFGIFMIIVAAVILISGEYAAEYRYQEYANTVYTRHIDMMP